MKGIRKEKVRSNRKGINKSYEWIDEIINCQLEKL